MKLSSKSTNIEDLLPAGPYPAVFKDIETKERQGEPDPRFKSTDNSYYSWSFEIDDQGELITLRGSSSRAFSAKAKGRRWFGAIRNKPVEDGEEVDTQDILGKPCNVVVEIADGSDGPYNRVTDVLPRAERTRRGVTAYGGTAAPPIPAPARQPVAASVAVADDGGEAF